MPRSRSSTLNGGGGGDGNVAAQFTFTSPPERKPRRPSITAFLSNAFSPMGSPSSTAAPTPNTSTSPTPLTSTVALPHTGSSDSVDSVSALNGHGHAAPPTTSVAPSPAQTRSSTPNKLSRRMRRSYSQSHARTGSVGHTDGPTLGQGATVVRTPQDATMFMAQPSAILGPYLPSRQSSLRGGVRKPVEDTPLTEHKVVNVHTATSTSNTLRPVYEAIPPRSLSRSPSAPTTHTSSRAPIDHNASGHQMRRLGTRASSSALHTAAAPSRNPYAPNFTPAAPAAGASSDQQFQQLSHTLTPPDVSPRISPTLSHEGSTRSSPSRRHTARPSNASQVTLTPLQRPWAPVARALPTPSPTPPPVLVSCQSRPTKDTDSTVLVTLRFGFSLDAEPNTHAVTVTMDTLRPAGGILVEFLDKVLGPKLGSSERDSGIGSSGAGTPVELPGPDMTDGSSEDSDYDELACIHDHYAGASGGASPVLPASPGALGRAYPPSAFTYPALPPLADLPAALAQAKAYAEASAATTPTSGSLDGHDKLATATAPLRVGRPRASTCPSRSAAPAPASSTAAVTSTITEVVVLLQREASSWHMIASRLCSGSWPSLDGRRRRVEEECRWAGMTSLVAELAAPPTVVRPGAPGNRSYI